MPRRVLHTPSMELPECGGRWYQEEDEDEDEGEGDISVVEVSAAALRGEYRAVRVLASGWYTQVFSVRPAALCPMTPQGRRLVLKAVRRGATSRRDFLREARYHSLLAACPHVLACLPPALATPSSFVLPLEEAPAGDLASLVGRGGVGEEAARRVACQVGAALAYTHAAGLVHRDLTPHNLLAMDSGLRQVKLADFGATRRTGAMVTRGALPPAYLAPEVACLHHDDLYAAHPTQDAWQLGLLLVTCLTGALPWAAPHPTDPHYTAWAAWACRLSTRLPPRFRVLSPRCLRLLRRLLHPEADQRCGAAVVQREAEGVRHPWLARDADPFEPCVQDAPFLRRAERKVSRALKHYLRRASPRYKTVTFATNLEHTKHVDKIDHDPYQDPYTLEDPQDSQDPCQDHDHDPCLDDLLYQDRYEDPYLEDPYQYPYLSEGEGEGCWGDGCLLDDYCPPP
ncbi:Serine/threonine-protein kinase meng-po [Chionoecetes opilio]|uniref:Serine/threonine-protein kinase meng-po n=1 Tax=Chionoecetes opilio TaxID=41210 RepID=A0A8J5CVR9_CHIOP|nr:Serine/threonine-protein kinase meng-po [Chionoecetes opilio]